MTTPKKGLTFTHKHFLDPAHRHPSIGFLGAKNVPKATMKITMVTKTKVYYNYAETPDTKGRWYMPRDYWQEAYGDDPH